MKDDTDKKKDRRDVLKAIGIATGAILLIIGLILAIQQLGIG
ncbi:MAG: twin-arginine translocation signal domain-containing protein [Clostridia bacterium]|nr:twin-arginine translocation signal domain-containing protein [Clostridia bacterium]